MSQLVNVSEIIALHESAVVLWKQEKSLPFYSDFLELVMHNHHFNYQLWQAEDKARRDDRGFEFVYHAKRAIDKFNQQRNNCMEKMDEWLFQSLKPASSGVVHSETPGMMIDRLSILALKSYHMKIESERQSAPAIHQQNCQQKWQVINLQRQQLADCLTVFIKEVIAKSRTFKVYHQFKMYNDPTLNPELYSKS